MAYQEKMDTIDLIITVLKDHEKRLSAVVDRLVDWEEGRALNDEAGA